MGKIYLVYYIDSSADNGNTIEGYVYRKKDFKEWLRKRNKQRRAEGELVEKEDEFFLEEIENLGEFKI